LWNKDKNKKDPIDVLKKRIEFAEEKFMEKK